MTEKLQVENEAKTIEEKKAEVFNRQACEMVSIFFKEIASIPVDEIYNIASGKESPILLEAINRTFTQFIKNGEGLNRIYFDSYERTVDQFVHTFKINIKGKVEENTESLVAQSIGKPSDDISYTDIARAIILVDKEVNKTEETPVPVSE